jgi:hypothetical protein
MHHDLYKIVDVVLLAFNPLTCDMAGLKMNIQLRGSLPFLYIALALLIF